MVKSNLYTVHSYECSNLKVNILNKMNFKDIHIGKLINEEVVNRGVEISRICNFLKCTEQELAEMYQSRNLGVETLLRWSKLLEYDFFRLYSHHLILYAPEHIKKATSKKTVLPQFRKNLYTQEIIQFILELLQTGAKTKQQVMDEYKIPKTTLYKWIEKYANNEN